jgi:hypothetical protein
MNGIPAFWNPEMRVERDNTVKRGLCFDCNYSRRIEGKAQNYYLCERSFSNPSFHKYPRLPVVRCVGYEPRRGN